MHGLGLAFRDRKRFTLKGLTIRKERAQADIWVCGPGAFVVLKALAFKGRGSDKDAYDLYYVLRNYGAGPDDVADVLRPLLGVPEAKQGLEVLRDNFLAHDGTGPLRVARFLHLGPDDSTQAEVVAVVQRFLEECGARVP